MTTAFVCAVAVGALGLASTVGIWELLGIDGRPPFRVIAGEAGIVAFGVAGLISSWIGGLYSVGFHVTMVVVGALLVIGIYSTMSHRVRQQELRERRAYVGLPATVTRAISPANFGEIALVSPEGIRLRLPAKSHAPSVLSAACPVSVVAVDHEFVYVTSDGTTH